MTPKLRITTASEQGATSISSCPKTAASLINDDWDICARELVINVSRTVTHDKEVLHHVAYFRASGNVDSEGLIGREREDHRVGFRGAAILRRYQAELGILLAAFGAQHLHYPKHFSLLRPRPLNS